MIGPIRAARACPAWANYALYAARCCRRLVWPRWLRGSAGWGQLSPSEGARGGPGPARSCYEGVCDRLTLSLADRYRTHDCSLLLPREPAEKWQPWPVAPPWTERNEIQWPDGDWPPLNQPIVIENVSIEPAPQIILWRDAGGLLDMWA